MDLNTPFSLFMNGKGLYSKCYLTTTLCHKTKMSDSKFHKNQFEDDNALVTDNISIFCANSLPNVSHFCHVFNTKLITSNEANSSATFLT